MSNDSKIIVALDYPDKQQANAFIERIDADLCKLKVGKELFTAEGPAFVESVAKQSGAREAEKKGLVKTKPL